MVLMGFYVKYGMKDLAEKLEKIVLMSHQDRLVMGQKSREKIEQEFDEKIVINKYLDAIKEILAK